MKTIKGRKKLNIIQIIGIVLIVSSISYFGYSTLRVLDRKAEIEQQKQDFIQAVKAGDLKDQKSKNGSESERAKDKVLVENLNDDGSANNASYVDEALLSQAIGYIEIKTLHVILPIFSETSKEALSAGVGVVETTDAPSDQANTVSVIAGHRGGYNGQQSFLHINKLRQGDTIEVTTKEKVLTYQVVGQEVIASTDWSKFTREKDQATLILMSCHPYPQNYQRLLVKAVLIKAEDL